MQELEPPDTHYLSAVMGWLGLGSLADARAELALIPPSRQQHPDVLEVRWIICAEEQNWQECLQIARQLLMSAPDRSSGWLHQAYALRRVSDGGVKKAWTALLPAFDKFPKEPTISYNLSCYACQMKQLDAARVWLQRALVVGGKEKIKRMALSDQDLQPLWDEIREL
jgi:hypothetical protein